MAWTDQIKILQEKLERDRKEKQKHEIIESKFENNMDKIGLKQQAQIHNAREKGKHLHLDHSKCHLKEAIGNTER